MRAKKFSAIFILLLALCALSACCITHDYTPATCTSAATCTKCGKVEGAPLGHTVVTDPVVEPTCTDDGLSEGSHCSVCGEVFAAQTVLPALGHDWAEATCTEPRACCVCGATEGTANGHIWSDRTFYQPRQCTVCGETDGEAAGYHLLVDALNPDSEVWKSSVFEDCLEWLRETAGRFTGKKELTVTGSLSGGDEDLKTWIDSSKLHLFLNTAENDVQAKTELTLPETETVTAIAAWDGEKIGIAFPGFNGKTYELGGEFLQSMIRSMINDLEISYMSSLTELVGDGTAITTGAELQTMLKRYEEIVFSIANDHNTTEEQREYALRALKQTVGCNVLTIYPSMNDWTAMLTNLAAEAAGDTRLEVLYRMYLSIEYQNSWYYRRNYDSEEQFADNMVAEFQSNLEYIRDNAAEAAGDICGLAMEIAYEGNRVYCIRFVLMDGDDEVGGVGYESFGEPDGTRTDAIVVYDDGDFPPEIEARHTLRTAGEKTIGNLNFADEDLVFSYVIKNTDAGRVVDLRLIVDSVEINLALTPDEAGAMLRGSYNDYEEEADLSVEIRDSDEDIVLPQEEIVQVTSEDELEAAAEEIAAAAAMKFVSGS